MAQGDAYNELLLDLRLSSAYSDPTITCGKFEAKVHKCVICPQSEFFKKACESGKWKEGHTGTIELEPAGLDDEAVAEDDPEAVRLMIGFFYLADYDPGVITKHSFTSAADESFAEVDSGDSIEQEAVEHDATTEGGTAQRGDTEPGPDLQEVDDAANQLEDLSFPVRKKKKKAKAKQLDHDLPSSPTRVIEKPTSLSAQKLLTTHAKMYSIAAKYSIRPLMDTAVLKFKSTANNGWNIQDLVAAIPIVYNQTPEHDNEMRDILEVIVLEHAYRLVPEAGFQEAIEHVEGLAFSLFKRLGALSRHQKVCRRCGAAFVSMCALKGCESTRYQGYSHDCDLRGPCRDCKQGTRRL